MAKSHEEVQNKHVHTAAGQSQMTLEALVDYLHGLAA
jgi:hypothetical protein